MRYTTRSSESDLRIGDPPWIRPPMGREKEEIRSKVEPAAYSSSLHVNGSSREESRRDQDPAKTRIQDRIYKSKDSSLFLAERNRRQDRAILQKQDERGMVGDYGGLSSGKTIDKKERRDHDELLQDVKGGQFGVESPKKELSSRPAIPHSGIRRSLNFVKEISIERQGRPQVPYVGYQQPSILAQTAKMDFCSSFPFELVKVEHTPPRGVPDLNLNLEEALLNDPLPPSDHFRALVDQRARAADARRRRLIKIREKNALTAVKPSRR